MLDALPDVTQVLGSESERERVVKEEIDKQRNGSNEYFTLLFTISNIKSHGGLLTCTWDLGVHCSSLIGLDTQECYLSMIG